MKKALSYMVMVFVAVLMVPLFASALDFDPDYVKTNSEGNMELTNCTKSSDNKTISCSLSVTLTSMDTEFDVTLTPKGGAKIISVDGADDNWTVTRSESGDSILLSIKYKEPEVTVEKATVLKWTYEVSGSEDCEVNVKLAGKEIVSEPEPTPTKKCEQNKDGEYLVDGVVVTEEEYKKACESKSVKTGVSFPFIALSALVVLAGGAYIATKNKAKMYKI